MTSSTPKGIIELGNLSVKCIIFTTNDNDLLEILSTSIFPSEGIHNGSVVNLKKASKTIRVCVSEAEKKAKVSIKKIYVITEQPEFLCTKFSKNKKMDGTKIHKEDIEFLLKEAKKQVVLNDNRQSIIHIFNHNYVVDGKRFIDEPIDVYADHLSHEMTFVTMPKNNIKNISQTFADCDIEVERVISSTFALAAKLLKDDDLKNGSTLINIGYEKISLGFFKNLALIHSTTFPIGTNHILKDISNVCSLSIEESENIINKIDFSFEKNNELFDQQNYLKKIYLKDSTYRKISKSILSDIIIARLEEICSIIKKQIELNGLASTCGRNLFITGGGANLYCLDKYFSEFFGSKVEKFSSKEIDNNFAACLGALKIIIDGWETEAIPKTANEYAKKTGILGKIFGRRT